MSFQSPKKPESQASLNGEAQGQEQNLVDHLTELRQRLIYSLWFIALASGVAYYFSENIFNIIRAPIAPYLPNQGLIFTAPMDKFLAHFKVALFSGVIVACPFWIYQAWKFVAPGLYQNEKKMAAGFVLSGIFLFLLGVGICYFGVLPVAIEFLMGFGGSQDQAMISISEYLSFFIMMCLAFGLSFELPLILVVLGLLGIVSHEGLRSTRRYAIVVLSVLAAVLTPSPDVVSMLMLLAPLVLLYELAIFLVGFFETKKTQTDALNNL